MSATARHRSVESRKRLGLWGEGSTFAKPANFIAAIEGVGVAAVALMSRDMKGGR